MSLRPRLRSIAHIHSQLERYRRTSTSDDKMQVDGPVSQSPDAGNFASHSKSPRYHDSLPDITYNRNSLSYLAFPFSDSTISSLATRLNSLPLPPLTESRSPTPQSQDLDAHSDQNENCQVVPRSRWQTMLLEAGGISAAVSEESMRRLKYCLQWLQVCALQTPTWCTLLIICFTVRHNTY